MASYDEEIDDRYEQQREEWIAEATAQAEARTAPLTGLEIARRVAAALPRRIYPPQVPRQATMAGEGSMYTSEPIPGVQSPFYAGERYIAHAELARRERAAMERAAMEARVTARALDAVYAAMRRTA